MTCPHTEGFSEQRGVHCALLWARSSLGQPNAERSVRSVGYYAASMSVVVGSASLSAGGRQYRAQSAAAHPLFSTSDWRHDVGLLRLAAALALGDGVRPVALVAPGAATPAEGSAVTVAGWGALIVSLACRAGA